MAALIDSSCSVGQKKLSEFLPSAIEDSFRLVHKAVLYSHRKLKNLTVKRAPVMNK